MTSTFISDFPYYNLRYCGHWMFNYERVSGGNLLVIVVPSAYNEFIFDKNAY